MKNILFPMVITAFLLLAGCNGSNNGTGGNENAAVNFPQVQLPSYINDNMQAVSYMVRNYWDKFFAMEGDNLSGTVHGVDSISFEDAFGMYAQLLTMAQPNDMVVSVKELFANLDSLALQGERKPLLIMMSRAEHYFYDPNSPVLNEEIYLCALSGILDARSLSELDKMQYEYQYRICSLNRVGTPAADFTFRELNGRNASAGAATFGRYVEKSLYDIKAKYTLVFFNNPDCNACAGILDAMKGSVLEKLVKNGELKVLAMYIDEDLNAWRENSSKYPGEWIYAHDHNFILRNNTLYGLRAIPSLYLLDKEKRVILKDAPVGSIISYFTK